METIFFDKPIIEKYDFFIVDCDGVLWKDVNAIEDSADAILELLVNKP